MVDRLEGLVRPIIGIENRSAQEAFDIMADRIRSHFATTPANGEQVERVEGLIHKRFPRADAQTVIALASDILATLPTTTQDARERVKALAEALGRIAACENIFRNTALDHIRLARTALGNKETDRHG